MYCSTIYALAPDIWVIFALHYVGAHRFHSRKAAARTSCVIQGLQFFDLKLIGAVISYLHGPAFTIKNLGKKEGVTQWSAPCFLQMSQVGLGLTVGMQVSCTWVAGHETPCHTLLASTPT